MYIWLVLHGGSTNGEVLYWWGAKDTQAIVGGQWWRLVTAGFLHIGIQHLVINMITLYFIGMYIEEIFGHWQMLVIYLFSVISGNLFSAYFAPRSLSAGASTGIFGLFGAFLLLGAVYRDNPVIRTIARQFLILVVINIVFDVLPGTGIDLAGHLGGLIGGFLSAGLISAPKIGHMDLLKRFLSGTILIVLIIALLWRLMLWS